MKGRVVWFMLISVLLSACAHRVTAKRPVATGVHVVKDAMDRGPIASVVVPRDDFPSRLRCERDRSADSKMQQSVVAELVGRGELYAALAQVENLPRDQAEVALLRADILAQLNSPEAISWYQLLLVSCLSGRGEHGLGRIEAEQGRLDSALARLQRAAKAYPVDPTIRHDLGVLWLQLGQLDRAYFELRTAEELARDDPRPRLSLMLLALLEPTPQAWREAATRWQPDSATRHLLHVRCMKLVAQGRQRFSGQCALALKEE